MSLASVAGMWNFVVKPEGRDTVVTSYLLNTTDTTSWTFTCPGGEPQVVKPTGMVGDTILA
jgi:hypothetical protein